MMKSISRAGLIAFATLSLGACSNMDEAQQRMLSGGVIGVTAGAATTIVTGGCVACGMAVGGAVGTAGGYLVQQLDSTTRSSPSSGTQTSSYNSSVPQGYPAGGY